jgi:glutathione-specific gamma-glutamylcyclotransferase
MTSVKPFRLIQLLSTSGASMSHLQTTPLPDHLWVFAYGSLIWNPGFAFVSSQAATIYGYHRSLCIYSHVHRGTPERPGLVLGLDRGGLCHGLAYAVAPEHQARTIAYLRAREQVTMVYRETYLQLRLADGTQAKGLAYVADRTNPQYAGRLPAYDQLRLVLQGQGQSGPNPDYVRATAEHLARMNIRDKSLEWLMKNLPSGDL